MNKEIKQRIDDIRKGIIPEGYKRTQAGIMPNDWPGNMTSKDVFDNRSQKHNGKDYVVLSATQDQGIIPRDQVDIDIKFDADNLDTYKKVEIGDFVISLRSFQGGIELSEYEGLVSPAYTVLKNKRPIDPGYYKAYFKTSEYIKRLNSAIYGIRDGKQIGFDDFGNLGIYYPPVSEQRRVAAILSACDETIELYKQKTEQLQILKKYLLEKMFPQNDAKTPEIRFPGFTDPWKKYRIGDLYKRRMERNNGQFDNTRWISVAKMYFQTPDKVTSNNIDTRTYVMRKGDIAFEGHPNSDFRLGRFVENDIGDGVISELFPIFRPIIEYDLSFWKYYIQIEKIMFPILLRCIEISYTSSNKLDEAFFLRETLFVPCIEEQKKIGSLLQQLNSIINSHQKLLEVFQRQKNAMIQYLTKGIVRVHTNQ